MKVEIYNQQREKIGIMEAPEKVLNAIWRPNLVRQVFESQLANARKPVAHTKDRSEVSGGGRKPWRQKHTGRARHGSIRSPLWIHGGITFGPRKDKKFNRKINKKMKCEALFSILSNKFATNHMFVIECLDNISAKTKNAATFLKNFFNKESLNVLLIFDKKNAGLLKAARNIEGVFPVTPDSLTVYDCLVRKNILIEKKAFESILGQRLKIKKRL